MTKRSSPAGSGRGRRGPVWEGYEVVALLLKQSLGLFGLVSRRRVLLPHPGSTTDHLIAPGDHHTLQHIQVHYGVDFQADFEDVRWHDVDITWKHTKDHNNTKKLCFRHPGHVEPYGFAFWGCWQKCCCHNLDDREHELYSGASPISLVEHCVTFRHYRRLLSLLGFVHYWPTSRWSATNKENRFSLKGNGIMSSFLGRQFYRSTLYIYIYIYDWRFQAFFVYIFFINHFQLPHRFYDIRRELVDKPSKIYFQSTFCTILKSITKVMQLLYVHYHLVRMSVHTGVLCNVYFLKYGQKVLRK